MNSDLDLNDDFAIFDGLKTLVALHRDNKSVSLNFTTTTFQSAVEETVLTDCCLVRMISDRQSGAVRQLFERGKSITNDQIQMMDTVIEVWNRTVVLKPGDTLEERNGNAVVKSWMILAVDDATLATRWRCGCRSL